MEPGFTPTREELYNAAEANPHGFGFAFLTNDTILTGRGMDATEVIERFLRIRSGMPDVWAMFHTRYTTHGTTSKSNCHPFRVGGSPDIVLAHNGVLPLSPADNRSDTRMFAEDWLPELGLEALDDETTYAWLEHWAAGSKVAIFSNSPLLEKNVYILNEHLGHWKEGIWWSNYSYEAYDYSKYLSKRYNGMFGDSCGIQDQVLEEGFADNYCSYCGHVDTVDTASGTCMWCYSCVDCYEDIDSCLCYDPERKKSRPEVARSNWQIGGLQPAPTELW
jgi:glutamine amidotransferase